MIIRLRATPPRIRRAYTLAAFDRREIDATLAQRRPRRRPSDGRFAFSPRTIRFGDDSAAPTRRPNVRRFYLTRNSRIKCVSIVPIRVRSDVRATRALSRKTCTQRKCLKDFTKIFLFCVFPRSWAMRSTKIGQRRCVRVFSRDRPRERDGDDRRSSHIGNQGRGSPPRFRRRECNCRQKEFQEIATPPRRMTTAASRNGRLGSGPFRIRNITSP